MKNKILIIGRIKELHEDYVIVKCAHDARVKINVEKKPNMKVGYAIQVYGHFIGDGNEVNCDELHVITREY